MRNRRCLLSVPYHLPIRSARPSTKLTTQTSGTSFPSTPLFSPYLLRHTQNDFSASGQNATPSNRALPLQPQAHKRTAPRTAAGPTTTFENRKSERLPEPPSHKPRLIINNDTPPKNDPFPISPLACSIPWRQSLTGTYFSGPNSFIHSLVEGKRARARARALRCEAVPVCAQSSVCAFLSLSLTT